MNAKRQGYAVSETADGVVRNMLGAMTLSERMDFGNARGMRNTLEKLVQAQANRLANTEGEITRDMLCEINEADARAALLSEEEQEAAAQAEQAAAQAKEAQDAQDAPAAEV